MTSLAQFISRPLLKYFNKGLDIPCYNVSELSLLSRNRDNNTECIKIGGDISDDITPLLNIDYTENLFTKTLLIESPDIVSGISVLYNKISNWYEIEGKTFISIDIPKFADTIKIKNIKLYNKNGMCFSSNTKANIAVFKFYILKGDCTDMNIPIRFCNPVNNFSLIILYTDTIPYYYKVDFETKFYKNYNYLASEGVNYPINIPISYFDSKVIKITTDSDFYITRPSYCNAIILSSSSKLYIRYDQDIIKIEIDVEVDKLTTFPIPYRIQDLQIYSETYPVEFTISYISTDIKNFTYGNKSYIFESGFLIPS